MASPAAGPGTAGRPFYKLTGSGNDFIFFDTRAETAAETAEPAADPASIAALCARGTGVGADGVVFLERGGAGRDVRIRYFNADGSLASLCGNATLCTVRLASILGFDRELAIATDAGLVKGRLREGRPEIDLAPVRGLVPDAKVVRPRVATRVGFAVVGVPHLVVLVDDIEVVDVASLGPPLRRDPAVGPDGANVNFISPPDADGIVSMRTFERGVEGETLACGTGAVASAAVLMAWGLALSPISILTRAGALLTVRLEGRDGVLAPSLSGEGRLVYIGRLP